MVHEVSCVTNLNLSLGCHDFPRKYCLDLQHHDCGQDQDQYPHQPTNKSFIKLDQVHPSLILGLGRVQDPVNLIQEASNSYSITRTVSLFSNSTSAKRDIDDSGEENRGDLKGGARKKLKLTKKQSFVLEESFKQHSTLNPKEKQTLAKSLNLQPRQVEIWFQNRRARTKLKQNEVDCALLKKCYEALTSDNMRLKREIHQLKETKSRVLPELLYKQFPAAGTCPSCDRIGTASIDTTKTSKTLLVRATKSHSHFFS
ncbi:hypothetical protein R6Q59_035391 [Mikania micrantha]